MNSTTTTMAPFPSSPPGECLLIEQLLTHPAYNISTWSQIAIILVVFICATLLFRQYRKTKINFHGNLSLLICNAIIFYLINAFFWIANLLRYKYLFFTYAHPCDLLTPIWLAFLLYSTNYFYLIANSGIHFLIMLERLRATLFVRQYEKVGFKYGIYGIAIVWFLSLAYTIAVIVSALAETESFSRPLGVIILTSKYNAQGILYSFYFALFISIVNAGGDYLVVHLNKNIQKRNADAEYSLSKNYQLNENILSMRIIFPLDFSYALCFGIYMVCSVLLRFLFMRQSITIVQYTSTYYAILTLPLLHMAITLVIYYFFLKSVANKRKGVKVSPIYESGQVYFKQLREQWKSA